MIDFTKSYRNQEFIYALYKKNLLDIKQVFEIANLLTNEINDDSLIQILLSSNDDENISIYFNEYLETLKLNIKNYNSIIIKNIFLCILNGEIELYKGLSYIYKYVVKDYKYNKTIGDILEVDKIMVNYIAIDDQDIIDPSQIKLLEQEIKQEMQEFINKHS